MTLLSSVWHLVLWDLRNDSQFILKFPHLLNGQGQCIYFMALVKNEISLSQEREREGECTLFACTVSYWKCLLTILTTKQEEILLSRVSGQSPQDAALIYDPPQRSNLASGEV